MPKADPNRVQINSIFCHRFYKIISLDYSFDSMNNNCKDHNTEEYDAYEIQIIVPVCSNNVRIIADYTFKKPLCTAHFLDFIFIKSRE